MKLQLLDNKVFFENNGSKKEIHPFWLRERVNGQNFVDKTTQQRLFDPTELKEPVLEALKRFRVITIRETVQKLLREKHVKIWHVVY